VVQGHEHEPVPGRRPDRDGGGRGQVGGGVHVVGLQLAGLVALGVNDVVAPPFPDVGCAGHGGVSAQGRERIGRCGPKVDAAWSLLVIRAVPVAPAKMGARARVLIAKPVRLLTGRTGMADRLLVGRKDGPAKRRAAQGRRL
jgi:hypothetical protein